MYTLLFLAYECSSQAQLSECIKKFSPLHFLMPSSSVFLQELYSILQPLTFPVYKCVLGNNSKLCEKDLIHTEIKIKLKPINNLCYSWVSIFGVKMYIISNHYLWMTLFLQRIVILVWSWYPAEIYWNLKCFPLLTRKNLVRNKI